MEAADVGSCPCIEVLVEEGGADVNMVNETDGSHPLLLAAAAGGAGCPLRYFDRRATGA